MTDKKTESLAQLKLRFVAAFTRYAIQDAEMRRLCALLPAGADPAALDRIGLQSRIVSDAERDYRALRLEYANRLFCG